MGQDDEFAELVTKTDGPPQEAVERMNAIIRQLQDELGYPPSVEEIAEAMYPVDRQDVWRQVCRYRQVTLADPLVDQEMAKRRRFTQARVREYLGMQSPERIETAACQMLRAQMEAALVELTAHEKEVMSVRFGLDDGRPRTLEEVAQCLGMTREQIRQIEAKALRKLRKPPTDPS
ncbi:MAG: sigma factor-like helix-turn-helix DNA-binding protein [Vulcanimicrobiota bacterium]